MQSNFTTKGAVAYIQKIFGADQKYAAFEASERGGLGFTEITAVILQNVSN
jgi:hypothetical protein